MAGGIVLLVAILVAINAAYVTHVATAMEAMWRALPASPDPASTPAAVRRMKDYLDRHETGLGFSIGFPILDGIDERLARLEAYAEAGENNEYAATLAALGGCIGDLRRHEQVHLRNVF